MSSAPYYYKSPARRPKESEPGPTPQRRAASKSPGPVQPKPGATANVANYLKLLEELKQLSGAIDETSVELGHLSHTFHKRCKLLRDPQLVAQAEELRRNAGIPAAEESDNN